MTPVETPPTTAGQSTSPAPASKPVIRRATGRDNGDVLGIGWLHGSFHLAAFRRGKLVGSWSAPALVKTMAELETSIEEGLVELKFTGTEACLLRENEQFIHKIEATPPFS